MLIGLNLFLYAFLSTIAVFLVVNIFRFFENRISGKYISANIVVFMNNNDDLKILYDLARKSFVRIEKVEFVDDKTLKLNIDFNSAVFLDDFIKELEKNNIKYSFSDS